MLKQTKKIINETKNHCCYRLKWKNKAKSILQQVSIIDFRVRYLEETEENSYFSQGL